MNQYEICTIIDNELPSVTHEIKKSSAFGSIYKIMEVLAVFTRKTLLKHDLPTVVRCMKLVDKIYSKGNMLVKGAVETIFVYSFSNLRAMCNKVEWNVVQAKMPLNLYSIYVKQVYHSGM